MDADSGYETSLFLCQVTMGFDSEKESIAKSVEEEKPPGTGDGSCASSDGDKTSSVVKVHNCDFPGCKAKFDRPWKLSAHRCIHTGERPYKCRKSGCTKSYTNLTHLRRHEQTSHRDKQTTGADGTPVTPTLYPCNSPGCNRKFQSKCSLKRHFHKKHDRNSQDVVKCPDCDLVFTKHNQLKSHMYTHDGIKPFKCELCNSSFLNHNDIMSHIRKHKMYKCSYLDCPEGSDKVFATRNELRSHLAQIHPSTYACENCDRTFSLKCRLTSHKLSCGSDKNEKPYKCIMDDCEHVFKLHRNMLQHVKHKHGEPRFACTIENCGKKFIWKISYNKHLRTYHESSQQTDKSKEIRQPKQRKKRKDADIPKHLAAELLSGVSVDKLTQLQMLKKDSVHNDDEFMHQMADVSSNDFTENDYDSEEEKPLVVAGVVTDLIIKRHRPDEDTSEVISDKVQVQQADTNSPERSKEDGDHSEANEPPVSSDSGLNQNQKIVDCVNQDSVHDH